MPLISISMYLIAQTHICKLSAQKKLSLLQDSNFLPEPSLSKARLDSKCNASSLHSCALEITLATRLHDIIGHKLPQLLKKDCQHTNKRNFRSNSFYS